VIYKKKWIQFLLCMCIAWSTCITLNSHAALPPIQYDLATDKYKSDLEWAVNQISSKFGQTLKSSIRLQIDLSNKYAGEAVTRPYNAAGKNPYVQADGETELPKDQREPVYGKMSQCRIILNKAQVWAVGSKEIRSVLAHEAFHCFIIDLVGIDGNLNIKSWLKEGSALWVGEELAGGSQLFDARQGWNRYLTGTGIKGDGSPVSANLFQRSYDAIGLFAHLKNSKLNPWIQIKAALTAASAGSSEAAFQALTNGAKKEVLETWASGLARSPEFGTMWNTVGPGITADRRAVRSVSLPVTETVEPVTQKLFNLTLPSAKVIVFNLEGYGALRWGESNDIASTQKFSPIFTEKYCLGKTCICEDGTEPIGVKSIQTAQLLLAITGDETAAAKIDIQTEDPPCKKKKDPSKPGNDGSRNSSNSGNSGDSKTGASYGDPHLITFDGNKYSFQPVGEFLLTKSVDGLFEVQTRQSQVAGQELSLNTAVAMKMASDKIGFYTQNTPDTNPSLLRINSKPVELQEGELVLSGGVIRKRSYGEYTVQWETGETVAIRITQVGKLNFLNLTITVPNEVNHYIGLLGNLDGNPANDFKTRAGKIIPIKSNYGKLTQALGNLLPTPIPLSTIETAFFDQLYHQFGDSWRIQATESIFDYVSGQSTETFTNKNFPRRYFTLGSLLPAQLRSAEKICRNAGVEAQLMEGCIFDVGLTNQPGFAQAAVNALTKVLVDKVVDRAVEKVRDSIPIPFPIRLPRFPF
jgi:hypothetical protein